MNKISLTLISLFTLFSSSQIFAKDVKFSSGEYQNTLVELYTSQGCSSCPPAERWLGNFTNSPELFKKIIPIAFHVDYWDYIGWKDEFAQPIYGKQQKKHYLEKNISQVYTPGVVTNGAENRVWRFNKINHNWHNKVGNLSVEVLKGKAYIYFDKSNYDVHIALTGSDFVSDIKDGENANKKLAHNFVALGYNKKHTNSKRVVIDVPTSTIDAKKLALVAWVTRKDSLRPLQATGTWL